MMFQQMVPPQFMAWNGSWIFLRLVATVQLQLIPGLTCVTAAYAGSQLGCSVALWTCGLTFELV
eukprot:1398292-Amphidinium_carterae.1